MLSAHTSQIINSVDGTDKWLTGKDSKESCRTIIEVLFLTGLKAMSKIVNRIRDSVPVQIRATHLPIHVYDVTDSQTRLAVTSETEAPWLCIQITIVNTTGQLFLPINNYRCRHINTTGHWI
jgi:hypothetical protein